VANLSLSLAGKSDNLTKDKTNGKSAQVKPADSSNAEKQRVIVDDATESVVFYGTEAEARELDTVLRRLDVPAEQVLLEAKVVALSKNAAKDLGIEWEWSKLPNYPEHSKTYHNAGKSNERIDYDTKRSYKGKTGNIPGIIQFGRGPEGYPFEFYFGAKLNALLSDGKADILARPNITTIQGHEAVINIGGDVPVPTQSVTDSTTTTTVTYRQAGIILRCTPRVNANGEITAQVHTEVSTPEFVTDLKAYRFQKRSADTTVRLQDGETMVIGGLIGSEDSRTMSKIPFLGDIPILGAFFKHVQHSHTESEVMIFLKAHVLPKT
jgi:type IV pilus assembly protein PilQ